MRTLIFEGIATSGKSTVTKLLAENLPAHLNIRLASEDETHVPIMEHKEDTHLLFFKNLITKLVAEKPDILILDRLYMTQAFRAKCNLSPYKELESFLKQLNPITIFLKVDEKSIPTRIQKATEHRNPDWADYIKAKRQEDDITRYYINQQRSQIELLRESTLPYVIIDTTDQSYDDITREILDLIEKKHQSSN